MTGRRAILPFVLALVTIARLTALAPGAPARDGQNPQNASDAVSTLTRMLEDERHLAWNDPAWLSLKSELDVEVPAQPDGQLARLARRAAARVELSANPLIATAKHASTLTLDTRPWFTVQTELPYYVEVRGSLDGAAPIVLAGAFGDAQCEVKIGDVAWARPLGTGFHRVAISVDVAYLRRAPASKRCAFRPRTASRTTRPMVRPAATDVITHEQRMLPGLSFGIFDTPSADVVVRAAQAAPARMLDSRLASVPFERWFGTITGRAQIDWRSGFCNEDEALWWHPSNGDTDQGYWRATMDARRKPRELCATALAATQDGSRSVGVRIAVGTLLEDSGDWQFIPPKLYEAFIDADANTLDVRRLADLAEAVGASTDKWPRTNLSVHDVTYTPAHPAPGQSVTVRAVIRNTGSRDVRYAHGSLVIVPCCGVARKSVEDFVRTIAAGATFVVERTVTLPDAIAGVSACVWPFPPDGREDSRWRRRPTSDANPADNCAEINIGRVRSE